MPADVIEIPEERYRELFDGQRAGKEIAPGPDGSPILQDPPPPQPRRDLTTLEFLDRFTDAELAGIHRAGQSDDAVAVWIAKAQAARTIPLDLQRTRDGMKMLVDKGLLTSIRRDEILG